MTIPYGAIYRQKIVPFSVESHTVPRGEAAAKELKKRTLTNLYNVRPQWLADAHAALDAVVAQAYGWNTDVSDEEALQRLLIMNYEQRAIESNVRSV